MFFFSSRRRHTRWNCDWSSDVCSSDLFQKSFDRDAGLRPLAGIVDEITEHFLEILLLATEASVLGRVDVDGNTAIARSEERRVGKECRSRRSPYAENKKYQHSRHVE